MRLDQWLVLNHKVRSRTLAEEVISRGEVFLFDSKDSTWRVLSKPSFKVLDHINPNDIKVESELIDYVARSGLKLKRALQRLNVNLEGCHCLDVGQSTGGFTQVLLEKGASTVVGLDVGAGQLSPEISSDSKVIFFENLDIRLAMNHIEFMKQVPFEFCVVDVSFISLTLVLGSIENLLKSGGRVLALVKPQFEVMAKDLDKKGLVKDSKHYEIVKEKISSFVREGTNLRIEEYIPSELDGRDGNKEFFILLIKS